MPLKIEKVKSWTNFCFSFSLGQEHNVPNVEPDIFVKTLNVNTLEKVGDRLQKSAFLDPFQSISLGNAERLLKPHSESAQSAQHQEGSPLLKYR